MVLHIINQSPFTHDAWKKCLQLMSGTDSLLLIEDAVLLLSNPNYLTNLPQPSHCYALRSDIEARGMQLKSNTHVQLVDFDGFVDLVANHDKTMSWF